MKKIYLVMLMFMLVSASWGQTQLAAWTFDATAAVPNTPNSLAANLGTQSGTATLYADGTNGSSSWITATSGNELTTFAGSTVNDPRGTPISGNAYSPLGGTANSANGKAMVISFSMTGFENPILTFATRGTSTGFNTHQWAWSTDNVTYTNFGSNTANTTSTFLTRTLDMSAIDALDNATTVYLRITYSGASTPSGNNRLDNIVINADVLASCSGAPSVQAGFGTITPTSVTADINVTAGTGGTGRVVKMNTTNSFVDMVDGADPAANTVYGGGEQVVFNSTGTGPFTVTSLTASTTYWLAVYEYNCAAGRFYLNPGATTSFTTNAACTGAPSGQAGFGSITPASFTADINVTAGAGGVGRVVKMNTTNSFTDMTDGDDPAANTVYGGGEQVIYNGTGTGPVTVTGLTASTTYYLGVYEYNCVVGRFYFNPAATTSFMTTAPPPAGLQIAAANTAYAIDFDNTVANVNNGQFGGVNLNTAPAAGDLNSDAWSIDGTSATSAATFGGTVTSGAGASTGGVTASNFFAFEHTTGNVSLGVQPTGSFFTPGNITLRMQNATGAAITDLSLAYKIYVLNDQARDNTFNLSYSTDNVTYTTVPAMDFTSTQAADSPAAWLAYLRSVAITGLSVANGDYIYLRWSGDDVAGTGSRDEFALDDISIVANSTSVYPQVAGAINGGIVATATSLSADLTSTGDIDMTGGNIYIGSFNLTGTAVTGGGASNYIHTTGTGAVTLTNITAASREFPVGNGTYNPLQIANGSGFDWTVRVEDAVNNVAAPFNTDKAINRTWHISPSGTVNIGPDVTFNFDDADNTQLVNAGAYNADPVRTADIWHYVAGNWNYANSLNTMTPANGPQALTLSGYTLFSPFAISKSTGPLPVTFLSFAGQKERNVNVLRWSTGSEINNTGFEVLRSTDGINYTPIAFVNSLAVNGNSQDVLNYTYTDNAVTGTKQYYRLRQIDFDNRSNLSVIVLIQGERPLITGINGVFPNPANSTVNVLVAAAAREKVTLVVSDMSGRVFTQKVVSVEEGSNTIPLEVSNLGRGNYVVRLVCENGCNAAAKFMKL